MRVSSIFRLTDFSSSSFLSDMPARTCSKEFSLHKSASCFACYRQDFTKAKENEMKNGDKASTMPQDDEVYAFFNVSRRCPKIRKYEF